MNFLPFTPPPPQISRRFSRLIRWYQSWWWWCHFLPVFLLLTSISLASVDRPATFGAITASSPAIFPDSHLCCFGIGMCLWWCDRVWYLHHLLSSSATGLGTWCHCCCHRRGNQGLTGTGMIKRILLSSWWQSWQVHQPTRLTLDLVCLLCFESNVTSLKSPKSSCQNSP